jgi:hypothetical protein
VFILGNNHPIGIFDSGVGGLTVVRALLDQLPEESFIYFGDTGTPLWQQGGAPAFHLRSQYYSVFTE